jgi:tetratricopeptide (TPR) repeat protein
LVHKDKGYGVAVMVNSDNGQIIGEIMRSVAKEYQWEDYLPKPYEIVPLEAGKLDAYAGRFLVNPDRVLTLTRESGKLYAQPTAEARFELLPISESEFIRTDQNTRYTFIRNADGKVEAVKIGFDGGETQARLITKDILVPYEMLMAGRTAEAMEGYRKIKKEKPANNSVAEERLNNLGYTLLQQKQFTEAIAVFKVNTELYPQSANVYDSLGEAYMMNGNKELAIASYKKSLELNPKNENAVTMLKKLEP